MEIFLWCLLENDKGADIVRARNIKPSFFTNPDLGECSPVSRLCFAGLWCCADRNGRLPNRPKFIKAQVFPYDNIEVEPLLDELERFGFIERYEVQGVCVISIPNFLKHQRPHVKEKSSDLPEKQANPGIGCFEHVTGNNPAHTQVSASTNLGVNEPALNIEYGMMNDEYRMRNEEVQEAAPVDRPFSTHLTNEAFSEAWGQWLQKQSYNRGRRLDPSTEQAQLYSLASFDTEEATEIVRYSVSRTDCKNLITNGDHKTRQSPTVSPRRSKVSFDEGLLK